MKITQLSAKIVTLCAFILITVTGATVNRNAYADGNGPNFTCFQNDDASGFLKLDLSTGQFEVQNCLNGYTDSGTGTITGSGNIKHFRYDTPTTGGFFKGRFVINTTSKKAEGNTINGATQTEVFELDDQNSKNNICACPL